MIGKRRFAVLLCGLAILKGGCTVLPVGKPKWPNDAPAQAYFEQVYDEDRQNQLVQTCEEYLDWIRRFYLGSDVYSFGWLELERRLVEGTEASLRADTANRIRQLGQRMSADWAKNNRLHHITSTMLLIWSQVIQEAAESGEHLAALDLIETDVAALLDQRLPAEAISVERYSRWIPDVPEIS